MSRFAHGTQVENAGYKQHGYDRVNHRPWVHFADVGRYSHSGYAANARADFLYRAHEGIRKKRQPQRSKAKLRARLRIGSDTAGIVVRRTGNKPRPHDRYTL